MSAAWLHLQVDAVDLVLLLRLAVFEPEDRRVQRHVDQVVAILRRKAGDVGLHGELRTGDADHLEPLLVDLHVPADRIVGAEERRGGCFAEHGDGRRAGGLALVEEPARDQRQVGDGHVRRAHAVDHRRIRLRPRQQLRRREPLARASTALMPSTLAWMTRKSWKLSPAESLRIFCSAW